MGFRDVFVGVLSAIDRDSGSDWLLTMGSGAVTNRKKESRRIEVGVQRIVKCVIEAFSL